MKRCEKDFDDKRFAMYKNNLRKSWTLIKELMNKKKVRDHTFNTFVINEELTSAKVKIADAFCMFYTSIGPNLANKIPSSPGGPGEGCTCNHRQNGDKQHARFGKYITVYGSPKLYSGSNDI